MNFLKSKQIPFFIALVAAVLTLISFFLPYASAAGDYKEYLQSYSDSFYDETFQITNADAVHFSLFEYGKMYIGIAGNDDYASYHDIAIVCAVLIAIVAATTLLVLLFAALRKAIPLLIFTVLHFGALRLVDWDFNDRGVLPTDDYVYGFGHYFYYICVALLLIGAIWMLVCKIKVKKEMQQTNVASKEETI